MSFVMSIGIFFYVLITLASVLSIINTLTMSINERTKEIGTLRSIGFTTTHISRLFTLEVLVLTIGSIVVSSICYLIVSKIINSLEIPFEPAGSSSYVYFTIVTSFKIAFIHAGALILITFITSYFSCKKKMNFKIAELLNEQGVFK
jgi:putative ABC transport system permease protein